MGDNSLYDLLNIDPADEENMKRFDGNAIIQEVKRNPLTTRRRYTFKQNGYTFYDYPLHQAISLGASIGVVEAIYNSYPRAVKEKRSQNGDTALLLSILNPKSANEVVLFLLSKWPGAARFIGLFYDTPLHTACSYSSSLEVVSSLLDCWPVAIKWKNELGNTPLHCACMYGAPYRVILLLLDKWPAGTRVRNDEGKLPLDYSEEEEAPEGVQRILSCASQIKGYTTNKSVAKEFMDALIGVEWWRKAVSMLDRHPFLTEDIGSSIGVKVMPYYLFTVGRCCKIATMWKVLLNKQDLFQGL